MIVQFTKREKGRYVGSFNSNHIEIKQSESGTWDIFVNDSKINIKPFMTKDRAIRQVEIQAERVVTERIATATAVQRTYNPSSFIKRRPLNK